MEQLFPVHRSDLVPETIYDDLDLPEGDQRPFVAVNMVSSVDGKITLDRQHKTETLGSRIDRALMGRLRVHFDAVLRGAETVRANPYFPGVPEASARKREAEGKHTQPLAIVVSGSLELPFDKPFFTEGGRKALIITSGKSDPGKREEAGRHGDVETVGEEAVDFKAVLGLLRTRYGVKRLLVEGGAALNYGFAQEGLLDTLFWTLAPKLSGFSDDLTMIEGPALIRPIPRLSLRTLYRHQDELFFRWDLGPTSS